MEKGMLDWIWSQLQLLLGLGYDVADVGALQMALRTVVIYAFTLVIVRLGSKRFLSEATAFDAIVGIMLGSVMSRAINGSAPFFPTMLAGVVLLAMHSLFAALSARIGWFGSHVKGEPVLLVKDGSIDQQGMHRAGVTLHDLEQAQLQGKLPDPDTIQLAYMERNGKISVVTYEQ